MIFTTENIVIIKLNNSGSLYCKKYIGIALKIKNTDHINIPELIQNKNHLLF